MRLILQRYPCSEEDFFTYGYKSFLLTYILKKQQRDSVVESFVQSQRSGFLQDCLYLSGGSENRITDCGVEGRTQSLTSARQVLFLWAIITSLWFYETRYYWEAPASVEPVIILAQFLWVLGMPRAHHHAWFKMAFKPISVFCFHLKESQLTNPL